MAASRALYRELATAIGLARASIRAGDTPELALDKLQSLIVRALYADNPRFNRARFDEWMQEVERGERDSSGHKARSRPSP